MHVDHPSVEGEIVVHHSVDVEAADDGRPYSRAVKRLRIVDCGNSRVEGVDKEAVLRVTYDLAHRAALSSDDRRATRHRLDDAEAERLVEVDEVQERPRTAEQGSAAVGPYRADVPHAYPVQAGFHELLEITAILDDPGDRQRHGGALSDVDRLHRPFVRVDPTEE